MIVPHASLSAEALDRVIEEYVTRDGTELGEADEKIRQVRDCLRRGELVLVYDSESESCHFLPPEEIPDPDETPER